MENRVLNFENWKIQESKKEESKEEKNPLTDRVRDLSTNMNSTVTFDKPKKLKVEDRVWHILSVTPNKAHGGIKVTYKDEDGDKEKKVDFFDFHTDVQEPLYNMLKNSL